MYISSSVILAVFLVLLIDSIGWTVVGGLALLLGLAVLAVVLAVGPSEIRGPLLLALAVVGAAASVRDEFMRRKHVRATLRIATGATKPVQFQRTNPFEQFYCPTCYTSYFTVSATQQSAVCVKGHQAWKPFQKWISTGRVQVIQDGVNDYEDDLP
jgi:hypothetical protein